MADFKHTPVTRFGAANIVAATTNFAAEKALLCENMLETYLHLCEDPDINIRKLTIANTDILLSKLKSIDYIQKVKEQVRTLINLINI